MHVLGHMFGRERNSDLLHQFFETSVFNFIIVTGRIGKTHCIIFQHSRLFGFKLTLSLLPWYTGNRICMKLHVSLSKVYGFFLFSPRTKAHLMLLLQTNFTSWIFKHYPVQNQAHWVILFPAYSNESLNLMYCVIKQVNLCSSFLAPHQITMGNTFASTNI